MYLFKGMIENNRIMGEEVMDEDVLINEIDYEENEVV